MSKIRNLKIIFDPLISAFHQSKGFKIIDFKDIKKVFLNLKEKRTKKTDKSLEPLIDIFKENLKLELYFR